MNDVTPEPRVCEVCRGPIRSNNRTGICTVNLECLRERHRVATEQNLHDGKKQCKHPDGCPNGAYGDGWCSMHWQRVQKSGEPGPAAPVRAWQAAISAGDVFGSWTALEDEERRGAVMRCRCECGNERLVARRALLKRVGCACQCGTRAGGALGRPVVVLRNRSLYLAASTVVGYLTVLEDAYYSKETVRCRCECGNEPTVLAANLKSGLARSCSCAGRRTTHGLSRHPLYQTWHSMVARCTDPAARSYADYGGRGIGVCEEWIPLPDGLIKFIEYIERELGLRPEGQSLDRIDNNGNYEPGNLRWATSQRQLMNRRSIAKLTRERDALLATVAERDAEIVELKAELAVLRAPSSLF